MKIQFDIKDISCYRSELMGWSIIWIMMLHFTFTQIKPLGFIAQFGFAGVDIFMMVSGLGLFFSLDKNNNLRHFYRKRLLRIFPTYYILGFFASVLLYHDTFWQYLFRFSTIGFWTGGIYGEWYIPSIVALYAVAPFIKKLFDKRVFIGIILICIVPLFMSLLIVANELVPKGEAHFFLLYRIPTFVFGMICAYWISNNKSSKYFLYISLIGIPIFILLYHHHHQIFNYKYFSLIFLLPMFLLCFIYLSKSFAWGRNIIHRVGKASLEIYLIQGMLFHAILTKVILISKDWHDVISIFLIIFSSLIGIIAHWLIGKIGINKFV